MAMYPDDIRDMSNKDILETIETSKRELFNLRFQKAVGQLDDMTRMSTVKRNIARLKTVLRERQLAAELAQEES